MSRYSAGKVAAGAGSTTLPIAGVTAVAANGFILREVGCFNTTTTAIVSGVGLTVMTAAGTPGATIAANSFDSNLAPAACLAKDTWTVTGTFNAARSGELGVGAAVGAGTILTFYGEGSGIRITKATSNGIVLLPEGTSQICNMYFVWDE